MSLFGNNTQDRQSLFDITLLPMNLSDGRNIGDLPGLYLYTAPKKAHNSRQTDILIVLFYVNNMTVSDSVMRKWADILSENYYAARGSFTMGISSAAKKLSSYLEKESQGKIFPSISMNTIVLRERSMMIAHAGPVHTTLISANRVQNYYDDACLPIQLHHNDLSFFSTDIHSEDIILLCPRVPDDWTNSAIMDVAGDSPLNAIRFLLDRSGGNLQTAVIQIKNGKGQISFRSKTEITANIQPEKIEKNDSGPYNKESISKLNNFSSEDLNNDERPLLRKRKSSEFPINDQNETLSEPEGQKETENEDPGQADKEQPAEDEKMGSLTGNQELPGSEDLPYNFSEQPEEEKGKEHPAKSRKKSKKVTKQNEQNTPAKSVKKGKFNFRRLMIIILCGLLIPIIVVSVLFFVYSGRSKDELHREYLTLAVSAAQKAITQSDVTLRETLWTESLSYADQALNYGTSPAATDLRKEAMQAIDGINGGIPTVYNYANQSKLPQGINITEISSSGQYTYALDSTSGSVLRFVSSGNGLSLDSNFTCSPGTYPEFNNDENSNNQIQVGRLIDFTVLPSGSPHSFVLAGVDANANVLYCSAFTENHAAALRKNDVGRLNIRGITFSNNALYVLDTQASIVWEYLYSNYDGFIY